VINVAMLGTVSKVYRRQSSKYNEKVGKNWEILSKIIDCSKFWGKFVVLPCGHDESYHKKN
jgi:hypothetical protein